VRRANKQGVNDANNSDDRLAALTGELARLEARVAQLEHARHAAIWQAQQARPARASAAQLETKLGTYWLSRIGIVSLITGTALLILTYFAELGPILRVALGYLIAAALIGIGWRIARRHTLFGNVVFGGGLAIAYFVTYALHFVRPMQVISSETLGVALVGAAIGAIVLTAHRRQSETVAGLALFLGLHTGLLTDVTALTLVCTTMLALGAVFFLAANRWVIVPISCVVAVYSTHATWALGAPSTVATPALSVAFLSVDFLLFASATLIHPDIRLRSLLALSLPNWLGMLLLGSYALRAAPHDWLFAFLCAFAVTHAGLAALARIRNAARSFVALQLALAIVTLALALPVRLHAWPLVAGWLALALVTAGTARVARTPAFGWLSLAILAVVQCDLAFRDLGVTAQLVCAGAFFVAERLHPSSDARPVPRMLFIAGAAAALLRTTAQALPAGSVTLGWVGVAFLLFAIGFVLRSSRYRWGGFGVLALAAVRVAAVDLGHLSANQRILTFVGAGVLLLVISFIYTRTRAAHAGVEARDAARPEEDPGARPTSRADRRPGR
jgi:uncharacterized membrane protein